MPQPAPATVANPHPPVGTLIDNGALELVEILGVGGYGVAYRAVDTRSLLPKTYAVKCLAQYTTSPQGVTRRQSHMQEVALHQLASAHPNVVKIYRVLEEFNYTFLVMEFAPDGDLFSQILTECRYLGNDALIKHVFMQLIDAVEYCHSLGIYHRDLKPENVLCFDKGHRVAVTDFGLATTEKLSEEFRTGSIYHMSPECHGGPYARTGCYSPMSNDIWSLGIILLNLATGRNPWKSATPTDLTFQAYLRDPGNFLPTVLPISYELNDVLIRMLELNWQDRISLHELRDAMEDVHTFYSDNAVFEGSMARCPWEAGMEIESEPSKKEEPVRPPARRAAQEPESHWSKDSGLYSDIQFAAQSVTDQASYGQTWTAQGSSQTWLDSLDTQSQSNYAMARGDSSLSYGSSSYSRQSPSSTSSRADSSVPVTPNRTSFLYPHGAATLAAQARPQSRTQLRKPLAIDTQLFRPRHFERHMSEDSYSPGSSMMQTALETPNPSSTYFMPSPGYSGESMTAMGTIQLGPSMAETDEKTTYMSFEDEDFVDTPSTRWGYPLVTEPPTPGTFSPMTEIPDAHDGHSYASPLTPSPEVKVWQDPWKRIPISAPNQENYRMLANPHTPEISPYYATTGNDEFRPYQRPFQNDDDEYSGGEESPSIPTTSSGFRRRSTGISLPRRPSSPPLSPISPPPPASSPPIRTTFFAINKKMAHAKSRSSGFFGPLKFFPRLSSPSPPESPIPPPPPPPPQPNAPPTTRRGRRSTDPFPAQRNKVRATPVRGNSTLLPASTTGSAGNSYIPRSPSPHMTTSTTMNMPYASRQSPSMTLVSNMNATNTLCTNYGSPVLSSRTAGTSGTLATLKTVLSTSAKAMTASVTRNSASSATSPSTTSSDGRETCLDKDKDKEAIIGKERKAKNGKANTRNQTNTRPRKGWFLPGKWWAMASAM
ncbi:hypothetical protein BDN72DRAFT_898705 [Pluteus cervinus]|uniref:Uncharacterized protein n=1 Tax=Pluteus cervinus TaxID=181527 RepID=A0ACD3AS34_9AGAR|nr:hypothetical protein BDN72DRAFT_898705 [Pluteus cervinus]